MASNDLAGSGPGGPEPPWWRTPRARGRRREPLTRDDIVEAAVRIVDADGVDALTVRRLGHELGTGSATLYWHISGKDELGELVYDRIMGEIDLPAPDPRRWEDQLKDLARQAYRVMLSHNDAVRLSLGRVGVGPNMLRLIEWMLALLRGAGIPDEPAARFGDILGRYLDASVLEVSYGPSPGEPEGGQPPSPDLMGSYLGSLPAEAFPNIVAVGPALTAGNADERFEFGLDLLVRGLAAYARPPGRQRGRR